MGSFTISSTPIDAAALQRTLADARAGACVTFEGWVRNRNEGQPVLSLEYEAYQLLAETEGAKILAEARAKFALLDAVGVHRVGHLQLGEMAVWVGVDQLRHPWRPRGRRGDATSVGAAGDSHSQGRSARWRALSRRRTSARKRAAYGPNAVLG